MSITEDKFNEFENNLMNGLRSWMTNICPSAVPQRYNATIQQAQPQSL